MSPTTHQLSDVKGVGEATAAILAKAGIDSVEALAAASIEDIASVPGFGPGRSAAVRAAAAVLLETPPAVPEPAAVEEPPAETAPASGKNKGKKKDKGKKDKGKKGKGKKDKGKKGKGKKGKGKKDKGKKKGKGKKKK